MRIATFVLLIALVFAEPSISVSNVLMPILYEARKAQFRVLAFNECFKWSSSQSLIMSVKEIKKSADCSEEEALLTVEAKELYTSIVWIAATDRRNTKLNIEATIAPIHSIRIQTKQRTIDVDTFEELQITALDKEGNTFSSLEGVRFNWNVKGHIQIVSFDEAKVKVSDVRRSLDQSSDLLIVRGLKVGRATVTVELQEKGYSNITSEVELIVIEKFTVQPSGLVYLPVNSKTRFLLLRAQINKVIEDIDRYNWKTTSSVSKIEHGILTTHGIERATLTINPRETDNRNLENNVIVEYIVVQAFRVIVELYLHGDRVTAPVVGQTYDLVGFLYDKEDHEVYSEDKKFTSTCPATLKDNKVLSTSSQKCQYTINSLGHTNKLEIQFYSPLATLQTFIHLPPGEQYTIPVSGGSGSYAIKQNKVSYSTQNLTITAINSGSIIVYDAKNSDNFVTIELHVSAPKNIFTLEERKELIVGQTGLIYVIAQGTYNHDARNYTQCFSLKFAASNYQVEHKQTLLEQKQNLIVLKARNAFSQQLLQNYDSICNSIALKTQDEIQSSNVIITHDTLSTSFQLKAFHKLTVPQLLVSANSQIYIQSEGGPTKWDQDIVTESTLDKGVYKCGSGEGSIKKYNRESRQLPFPQIEGAKVIVKCENPDSLEIYDSEGPIEWLEQNKPKKIFAVGFDKQKHKFDDISSLQLTWTPTKLTLKGDQLSGTEEGKIQVSTVGYKDIKGSFKEIKAERIVRIFNQLKLDPPNVSILQGESVQFKILNGSGDYHCYLNDEQLDLCTLKIKPTKALNKVKVVDRKLKQTAEANLEVVQADEIEIIPLSRYVISGDTISSQVIIKSGGRAYNISDTTQIKLESHLTVNQYGDTFTMISVQPEDVTLTAHYKKLTTTTQVTVLQEIAMKKILYMSPNCSSNFKLPKYEQVALSYRVTSDSKIEINSHSTYANIRTNSIGTHEIKVEFYNGAVHLRTTKIQVKVNEIDGIKLYYGGRSIIDEAAVRVVAIPTIENHEMELSDCDFIYQWRTPDVVQDRNLYAISTKGGEVSVRVKGKVATTKIDRVQDEERNLFAKQQDKWRGPLLVPTHSTLSLQSPITNIADSQSLSSNNNELITKEIGPASVVQTRSESFLFKVDNVYQLYPESDLVQLKNRQTEEITITLLSLNGRAFETVNQNKFYILDIYNPQVVKVSIIQGKLALEALKGGNAIVKIGNEQYIDFIRVQVGQFVAPTDISVYVGSIISFQSEEQGPWSSTCGQFQNNLLTVDVEGRCLIKKGSQSASIDVKEPLRIQHRVSITNNVMEFNFELLPKIEQHNSVTLKNSPLCSTNNWFMIRNEGFKCIVSPAIGTGTMPRQLQLTVQYGSLKETIIQDFERTIEERQFDLADTTQQQIFTVPFYEKLTCAIPADVQDIVTCEYLESQKELQIIVNMNRAYNPHNEPSATIYIERQRGNVPIKINFHEVPGLLYQDVLLFSCAACNSYIKQSLSRLSFRIRLASRRLIDIYNFEIQKCNQPRQLHSQHKLRKKRVIQLLLQDRLQAQRRDQLQKKEQAINKLSDDEIVAQLKAKGLPVFGTKQEKLDRLKKANGLNEIPEAPKVQVQQPKSSVVDNIKKMEMKREERRNRMEEMKREKADRKEQNQLMGKNVDLDFELMIEKTRLKEGLIQEHQSTENIKLCVCVRKRPIFNKEEVNGEIDAVSCSNPMIRVHEPKLKVDGITKYVENHTFQFDNTFNECEEGQDIYECALKPILDLLMTGGVVTCFAYGQTGSGKTYTMKNIQEQMVTDIFQIVNNNKVYMSFFEIYAGKCYDLLNNKSPLQILEDKNNNIQVQGLSERETGSANELFQLMEFGHSVRTTHATAANDTSSRSHAIIQLMIRNGTNELGKLILVDLAGSERAQDTQSNNRQRRMEGAEINKSLLALKECVRAMDSAAGHVPFRASKLTLVLRDSFISKSNKSRIVMIACVSPGSSSADHTLNTLRYADRLKDKNNQPKIQVEERDGPSEEFLLRQQQVQLQVQQNNNQNQVQQPVQQQQAQQLAAQQQAQNVLQQQQQQLLLPRINQVREDEVKASLPKPPQNNNSQVSKQNLQKKQEKPKPQSQPVPQPQNGKQAVPFQSNSKRNEDSNDEEEEQLLVEQQKKKNLVKDDVRCMKETMMKQEKAQDNQEFFDFHDKVNTILEEQDEILNIHMAAIKEDAKLLTQESELISSIQGVGIVDYDVDTYVQNLEGFIKKKLKIYNLLNKKLTLFKQHLKEEEEISSKMKNTFYY